MSRRILLSEHGGYDPIIIRQHDVLFGLLSLKRFRPRQALLQISQTLTTTVSILLDDDIARHVIADGYHVGFYLFRLHKETMCRYVQACSLNGVPALQAIRQYYDLQRISEDDYQEESAWKSWQRWSKYREKKRHFFKQNADNPSAFLLKKRRNRAKFLKPMKPLIFSISEMYAELATARFITSYRAIFGRPNKKLEKHVRIYYYIEMYGLSSREVQKKFQMKNNVSAWYAKKTLERKAKTNAMFKHLLNEQIALPHPA